jgi:hypothetical protein
MIPEEWINQVRFFNYVERKKYDVDHVLRKIFKATVPEMKSFRKSIVNTRSRKGSFMLYEV